MRFFPWGFWLLCVAAAASSARSDGGNKAKSCSELRQLYGAKGFSPSVVPQAEISDMLRRSVVADNEKLLRLVPKLENATRAFALQSDD
ncbi:Glypican-1 [Varanus komodoensis]|nr:Glypican-1 [Varanus komodoensis]